jgi:hypothetical protein
VPPVALEAVLAGFLAPWAFFFFFASVVEAFFASVVEAFFASVVEAFFVFFA